MQTITAIFTDTLLWAAVDTDESGALAEFRAAVGDGDDTELRFVTVTADQTAALRAEAMAHGDYAMVDLCDLALCGDTFAAVGVVQAIDDARAAS